MMKAIPFDRLPTVKLEALASLCDSADFAGIHHRSGSLGDFLCSLPALGAARDLMRVRDAMVSARRDGCSVLLACGGTLPERGLSPVVIHAIADGRLSGIALTGSAMVRDVEIALTGAVFDRAHGQGVGAESGALIKEAIDWAAAEGMGLGEGIGRKLLDSAVPYEEYSMLASAVDAGIPVTVHPAIGADAYHRFPHLNGESFGAAAIHDFRRFSDMVANCDGGVVLNVASAVVMPRLLMEALDAACSSGLAPRRVTACLLGDGRFADAGGVIREAVGSEGRCCVLEGAIELLFPLLMATVVEEGDGGQG